MLFYKHGRKTDTERRKTYSVILHGCQSCCSVHKAFFVLQSALTTQTTALAVHWRAIVNLDTEIKVTAWRVPDAPKWEKARDTQREMIVGMNMIYNKSSQACVNCSFRSSFDKRRFAIFSGACQIIWPRCQISDQIAELMSTLPNWTERNIKTSDRS